MRGVNRCLFRIHWTRRSRKEKQDAVTAQRNLEAKNRELGALLEEASWASFNQADDSFASVNGMKGSPYWRER